LSLLSQVVKSVAVAIIVVIISAMIETTAMIVAIATIVRVVHVVIMRNKRVARIIEAKIKGKMRGNLNRLKTINANRISVNKVNHETMSLATIIIKAMRERADQRIKIAVARIIA